MFQFEGSLSSSSSNKSIQLYGTLPHRRKNKSTVESPLKSPPLSARTAKKSVGSLKQDNSRSAVRRAEGFSRLLEFTRQQVKLESSTSADFDVTQSLPVCPNNQLPVLDGGVDSMGGDRDFEVALSSSEAESSDMNVAPAPLDVSETSQPSETVTIEPESDPQSSPLTTAEDVNHSEGDGEASVLPVTDIEMEEQERENDSQSSPLATAEDGAVVSHSEGDGEASVPPVTDVRVEEQERESDPQSSPLTTAEDGVVVSHSEGDGEASVLPVLTDVGMEEQEKDANGRDVHPVVSERVLLDAPTAQLESVNPETLTSAANDSNKDFHPPSIEVTPPPPPTVEESSKDNVPELSEVMEREAAGKELTEKENEPSEDNEPLNASLATPETIHPTAAETQPLLPNRTQSPDLRNGGLYDAVNYWREVLGRYLGSRAVLVPLVIGVTSAVVFYSIGGFFSR